ncbi:UDP-N-acetylglucosamine 2-epimerase (non-hydrolyzing) [bacterium]|nr:UDP-N-acetylglucosamine 2-epimerase (non-hydrolyzing) [bacterium]
MKPIIDGIVGARPNMMKMAPLARSIIEGNRFDLRIIHTGQHFDFNMSGVFLAELGLPKPFIDLGAGAADKNQDEQTAAIIERYGKFLDDNPKPRGIVVVGDVNSTMACSIVAAKREIPIAHVEAGLRSFDRSMPEEINRIICDSLCDILLVSDPAALDNLAHEGHTKEQVHFVGNIMIDNMMQSAEKASSSDIIRRLGIDEPYAFLTLHRPSNVDNPEVLKRLIDLFDELSQERQIVFAVHPRTRHMMDRMGYRPASSRVIICDPLRYIDTLKLMSDAWAVLTDSGGMQEECSVLKVPCITLRSNTERPVTISIGSSVLVGNDPDTIRSAWSSLLEGKWKEAGEIPLWDGKTAGRIVEILTKKWL